MNLVERGIISCLIFDHQQSNAQIADKLHKSESSIKGYITKLFAKFGVTWHYNLAQAAKSRGFLPDAGMR